MKSKAEKYLRRYLKISPLGLALWRSVEALHLSKVSLERPILDIGCGFGEFALVFADEQIDVGVDIAEKDLRAAAQTKKYKKLVLSDAREMPFADNSFGSIFSISTFEHIQKPQKLLKEAYRVLKPGGVLAVTIETDEVDKNTFYRQLLKDIGFPILSKLVSKHYDMLFHRHVLVSKKEWEKRIRAAGFAIERSDDIISPAVAKLYDLFLITSWPSQLLKPFIGRRIVYRPDFTVDLLVKFFLKYVEEDTHGTNLFVVARKPTQKTGQKDRNYDR